MFTFEKGQRWIYVLLLEEGKLYVGQTDNLIKRMKKHGTKKGAEWTNIYKPINFLKIIDSGVCTEDEVLKKENEVTIEIMNEYGWLNVRGGSYSSPNELLIYKRLLENNSLPFAIEQPLHNPKHILKISKGMNRNRIKLDLFKEFDEVTKATIFASISGTFGSRTNNEDKLFALDVDGITELWLSKNETKYLGISRDEVYGQFEKLKRNKIDYKTKNEGDLRIEK
jgi:predicted GIY-YIG superfamily endonuclease